MGKIADRIANKQRNKTKPKLVGWYWGYKAGKLGEGFEFTNSHMELQPQEIQNEMGNLAVMIKQCSDFQNKLLLTGDVKDKNGHPITVEQFLDQEQQRLDAVVQELKDCDYRPEFLRFCVLAVIACCAISSLVLAGRLKQDEYNGDQFAYLDQ
jgi:hypothetical protein